MLERIGDVQEDGDEDEGVGLDDEEDGDEDEGEVEEDDDDEDEDEGVELDDDEDEDDSDDEGEERVDLGKFYGADLVSLGVFIAVSGRCHNMSRRRKALAVCHMMQGS